VSDEARVNALATYNGEVGRGLVHTPEYVVFMQDEQRWFNEVYMPASWERMGYELDPDSGSLPVYRKVKRDSLFRRIVSLRWVP
jgi:hypothetical protein